jgi:hypothetical protein
MQSRREWKETFEELEEKYRQQKILYLLKLFFKVKTFSVKQKLKEFVTRGSFL